MSTHFDSRRASVHSVYLIIGPDGPCYVGAARDVAKRWAVHKSYVRARLNLQPVHTMMARVGLERFSCEVVVQSPNFHAAREVERIVIAQLTRDGAALQNVKCTPPVHSGKPLTRAAEMLIAWRSDNGLSRNAAAKVLGTTDANIAFLENARHTAGRPLALRLSRIAGIPFEAWTQPASQVAA